MTTKKLDTGRYTKEQFDEMLEEYVLDLNAAEILNLPGVYDVVALALRDDVIAALDDSIDREDE